MTITRLKLHCPDLRVQDDGIQARQALESSPGVGRVEVDYLAQTMYVETANQDNGADVIRALSDAGFAPDEVERLDQSDHPA